MNKEIHVVMVGYDWQCGGWPDGPAFTDRSAAEAHAAKLSADPEFRDETQILTLTVV